MTKSSTLRRFPGRLLRATRGIAIVEFALATPIVLGVTLTGLELTNFVITKMRVSQLALQIADNGSRIGTSQLLTDPTITEAQINDLITGANMQSGSLGLLQNGRIIISSLEPDYKNSGKYFIHWQRCKGAKVFDSSYGTQYINPTTGAASGTGTNMTGMGPTGRQVISPSNSGVIYVEISYNYRPLFFSRYAPMSTIHEVAAMTVRNARYFNGSTAPTGSPSGTPGSGVYNPGPGEPSTNAVTASYCNGTYSAS